MMHMRPQDIQNTNKAEHMNFTDSLDPEAQRAIAKACNVWTSRLIDLSRSNPLLFYRDYKLSTLDLSKSKDLVKSLLAGQRVSVESLASSLAAESAADSAHDKPGNATRQAEVFRKLIAIRRKALSNFEEKGIETLYLAIGMATWPAADGGKPDAAPVLLLPAKIESRGQLSKDLYLMVTRQLQINAVLLYVLRESYRISVNAATLLGDGNSGEATPCVDEALAHFKQAAATVPQLVVEDRVVLANFHFAKMAMVEDLKRNSNALASSTIVAAIAGHRPSRQKLARAIAESDLPPLDERPARDDYLVLDADASQQRAIVCISKGQSGVIQGPPGTGKSQTIANLIAQSVAEGRRVLFVAEKRAALDAVITRLNDPAVGLGHLVLDLHGASVSRREVMAQLSKALEQIRQAAPAEVAESVHREFESRRRQLNEYAIRINQIRQPTGLSVHQMVGRLMRLPNTADTKLRLRGRTLDQLTAECVTEVKQWLRSAAAQPTLFLGTDPSPWNGATIKEGQQAEQAIDLASQIVKLWSRFEQLLAEVVRQIGARHPSTLSEADTLIKLLQATRQVQQHYRDELFDSSPGRLAEALTPATRGWLAQIWATLTSATYRSARRRLIELRRTSAPAKTLRAEAQAAEKIKQSWQAWHPSISIPPQATDVEHALNNAFEAVNEALTKLDELAKIRFSDDTLLATIGAQLHALANDRQTPLRLPAIIDLRSRLSALGLEEFISDLREHRVPPEQWADHFERIWLHSALEHALASDNTLASFSGRTHEQLIREFRDLDRERVRLAAWQVRRIHANRAVAAMNAHPDQEDLVRREVAKHSRHLPLRELLAKAPDVLTRIAPCWVASPLSVSQLIDGSKRHFDLVIFDEASQVLQEEAIPALYRAEQVVVAGDRHQLPPTIFFATLTEEELTEEKDEGSDGESGSAAVSGFESILDTLEAFLPNWHLTWHYRSEDERLIAFSNAHVYDGRLITFPSIRDEEVIRHILVPHRPGLGGQEESSSLEVEEVVRQVILHAEMRSHESLGVITMGIRHANHIQAAIDRELQKRPDLAAFFSLERKERFFVKNLETVQGDERDAIILSIGYGKTPNGDLPHHFGPLTRDVGYRRLNVAITRARRRMCVISSFSHDDIDLSRSSSRGVQLLKAYLKYAASGGAQFPEVERVGSNESLNPFEADVRDALEARGIKIRPQFGVSRYRIDLVAMHPEKPGRPVLAIECDGASYHSSPTARDRDRLRQAQLEKLGWRFHRIWSLDWFHNREQEIERAVAAYEAAVRLSGDGAANCPVGSHEEGSNQIAATVRPRERKARPMVVRRQTIDQYSDYELLQIAEWVVSDGLPRTDKEIVSEVFKELPFSRMGNRIRERLERIVAQMHQRSAAGY